VGTIKILDKEFNVKHEEGEPYATQAIMLDRVKKEGNINISIDYSEHPLFSVVDNIVFRTVHDYIVHILGNRPFGAKGEIQSYNLHAKLAPNNALPALFTEIVGQACVVVTTGEFPPQKIAVLNDFDFNKVGYIKNYTIQNKTLVPLSATN
jgi:hypothetical protein